MKLFVSTLSWVLLAIPSSAQAGLRCDHDLVQEGESAAQLLLVCGEPVLRQTLAVDNTSTTEGIVEQWTYDFGPGTLLQIVTIEVGAVSKIEDGERR